MDADQAPRIIERFGDFLDRQRRCVRREHRSGLELGFEALEQLLLDVQPFDDRFDYQIGARHMLAFHIWNQARHRHVHGRLAPQALLEQVLGPGERHVDLPPVEILQADLHARHHAPGRDVAAHGAGADHMHPQRTEAGLGRIVLQHFGDPKHAPQIARRIADHQRREGACFRRRHPLRTVAKLVEKIDQPERRRIVIFPHLGCGLLAHLLGQPSPDGASAKQAFPPGRTLGAPFAEHRLARRPAQPMVARNKLVHDPHGARGGRPQHAAGQHHLHGIERAGALDRPHRSVEAGKQAELDLGQPQTRPILAVRDAVVAGHRKLQAAAEAEIHGLPRRPERTGARCG